jgi:hypothetical protein
MNLYTFMIGESAKSYFFNLKFLTDRSHFDHGGTPDGMIMELTMMNSFHAK